MEFLNLTVNYSEEDLYYKNAFTLHSLNIAYIVYRKVTVLCPLFSILYAAAAVTNEFPQQGINSLS